MIEIATIIIFIVIIVFFWSMYKPSKEKNQYTPYSSPPKTYTPYTPHKPQHKNPKVERLNRIIESGKEIKIHYRKFDGTETTRTIKPLRVMKNDGYYYVRAYCHLREDERTFKMSRMKILKEI